MNKVMVFLHAAPGLLRDDFQHWMLRRACEGFAGGLGVEPMTLNLVRLPPDNLPYRPPSDLTVGQAPEYDLIAELWGARDPMDIVRDFRQAVAGQVSVFHAYAVTATEIYHRRDFHRGLPSEGIKLIGRLMFHADMPDTAVRRSWALHAGLAERVHVGSARYVQNWVDRVLLDTSPPARGIPIMHFPGEREFFEAFVDSPRGMQEIIQDTSHFVAGGPRCYTTEYVIRGPG